MLLKEFREYFLDKVLDICWQQWSSLGVAGYKSEKMSWVFDPEALLLFTATVGRYDQRLFDEVLDWLNKNERFINVQRLNTLLKKEEFESPQIIKAIAHAINQSKSHIKWKKLAVPESSTEKTNLFFLKSGVPMPVVGETDISFEQFGFIRNPVQNREMSKPFPSGRIESLWLQLRAFTGMSSRAETLLYLLINDKATIQEIADQTYFAWRSIQDVLFELGHTGLLNFPVAKKGRVYRIDKKYLINMFVREGDIPESWICWPPLFRVLEQIWMTLNNQEILKASRLEQAAILRRFTEEQLLEKLEKSQIGSMIGTSSSYQDEAYLDFWQNSVIELLEIISGKVI